MSVALLLIPLALILLVAAIGAFFWAVDAGQFDDLDHVADHALDDEPPAPAPGPAPQAPSPALPQATRGP
jgi:cbb3-type cytochrome oxidase maturation protein